MPTVELTINGQTKRVEVGDGATPADIDEIAKSLSGGGEPAAAPAPSTEPENAPTALGRAQQQVEHIGRSYIEAGRRIGSEMFPNWISAPEGTPDPKDRTMLSRLGDLALVTSPVVAPELMLAGSGMSVASRALGAPQWLSDALGVGTELLTGGVQTVGAVKKAIQAPGKAAEAAQAATKAAEAARTGQAVENVAAGVGEAAAAREAVHGTAAAEGAAGISDAAATRKAAEDIEKLQTATPREAGTTIREAYPPAEAARRSAFQEGTYDKIAAYAKAKGLAATNQNAVGQTLAKSLETAEDEWGDLARTAESKQVKAIQEQLKSGAPVEWEDLDKAEKALQRINGPSSVRKAIADAKKGLLEGTPAAKALESANQQWRLAIRPAKDLAATIDNAESPVQAFQKVVGSGKDPHRLEFVRKVLVTGGQPEKWSNVVGGFFTDLAQRAKGDPLKMAKLWETVRPEVRAIIDPNGVATEAFTNLTKAGGREVAPVSLAEPALRSLPEVPQTPAPPAGSRFKQVAQGGAYAFGVGRAAQKFYHGDWWGGLKDLGIGAALANPQIAASAAVPLARTGAAVVGSPGGQEAIKAYDKFLTQPSEMEQSGTSSEAPPAPSNAAPAPPSAAPPAERIVPGGQEATRKDLQGRVAAGHITQRQMDDEMERTYGPDWRTAQPNTSSGPAPTAFNATDYDAARKSVARVVGVPENLMRAVQDQESAGDPRAVSYKGARGLMQLMPDTFREYASRVEAITGRPANIDDPLDNLVAGALHLRDDLNATSGSVRGTAERYFGGPDPRLYGPKTAQYGSDILRRYTRLEMRG
ncbi:MAG TPA: lytic transglycosylase domain-containing protein [Methylomirabilota bacterium]|nr:lytic transglycosylase domain-containing protein [Methylomirabilota bacterium]